MNTNLDTLHFPYIKLQGKGAIHVVPDVTRLVVTIEQWFDTYEKAYAQASNNTSWMVKILEFNHKPGTLAKTTRFDISDFEEPVYNDDGKFLYHKKDGYMLSQRIKVDLPIDNKLTNNIVRGVGKFIPSAQINIDYTLLDQRPSELKMLARAVSDAKEKAGIMAAAAGCQLGRLLSIDYDFHHVHVASQARQIHSNKEASHSTADSLNITPDDLVISDTVEATFELLNP